MDFSEEIEVGQVMGIWIWVKQICVFYTSEAVDIFMVSIIKAAVYEFRARDLDCCAQTLPVL
jgi:hypothetical protein